MQYWSHFYADCVSRTCISYCTMYLFTFGVLAFNLLPNTRLRWPTVQSSRRTCMETWLSARLVRVISFKPLLITRGYCIIYFALILWSGCLPPYRVRSTESVICWDVPPIQLPLQCAATRWELEMASWDFTWSQQNSTNDVPSGNIGNWTWHN